MPETGAGIPPGVSANAVTVALLTTAWPHAATLLAALGEEPGFIAIRLPADSNAAGLYVDLRRLSIVLISEELLDEFWPDLRPGGSPVEEKNKIVVISASEQTDTRGLIERGCSGVLPNDASANLALHAIKAVVRGEIWAPRKILADVLQTLIQADQRPKLTKREEEIFALVVDGRKNHDIAEKLFISKETVRWHLRRIYAKLGLRGRPESGGTSESTASERA